MASTLPSSTSDYKLYSHEPFITPQEYTSQSNNDNNHNNYNYNIHDGLKILLDQEDYYYSPYFNNNLDNFVYPEYINSFDCYSSNLSSMIEVPGFRASSCLDYYNSQVEGGSANSSGSTTTYEEFESNDYSTSLNCVPSSNNNYAPAATPTPTPECWGFQGHTTQACGTKNSSHSHSHNNAKVGKYSVEERKDRILRYLKKRSQRNFRKTIKYTCRKTLADRRVRIRGRFAKNQDEESFTTYGHPTNQQESIALPSYNGDHEGVMMQKQQCKDTNEELLQESIANLLYPPYIAGWHQS